MMMDENRLQDIVLRWAQTRVLVVGDFVLDRRLQIDPARIERSEETGLPAHQVVAVTIAPGAAGQVAAALRAPGSAVVTLGVIGDDGDGYELRRSLRALGIDERAMVVAADRYPATSILPVNQSAAALSYDLERLDIRSRSPLAPSTTAALIERLRSLVMQVHAVIVVDRIPDEECGVVTSRLRLEIVDLAACHPDVWFLAHSRWRTGLFRNVIVVPNARECVRAVYASDSDHPPLALVGQAAGQLHRRTGKPVIVTLGLRGMLVIHNDGMTHIPAIPVTGPINAVGANDSVLAVVTVALCAGATLDEAVQAGSLAAAATMRSGVTGGVAPDQIVALWRAYYKYSR